MRLGRSLRQAALAFLLWSLAYNLMTPLLPLYAGELGADPMGVGAVGSATAAGAVLMVLPLSWLSDRGGRRTALIAGWTTSAAGFITMSFASSWLALLPGAFLSSGALAALPALNALAIENLPRAERSRGFSLLYAAAPLGAIVGSALAGVVAASCGLRAGAAVAGVSILAATAALLPIRETRAAPDAVCAAARRPGAYEAMRQTTTPGPTRLAACRPAARCYGRRLARRSLAGLPLVVVAGAGFMLLAIPGSFITPFLRDVSGQTLVSTGLLTALLSGAQLLWALLFSVWPRDRDRVRIGPGSGWWSFPASALQALLICLAANALFGLLMPLRLGAAVIAALLLRGSQYTLQPIGAAMLGDVAGDGPGLTMRLTLLSAVLGAGAAAAPVVGGWLYSLAPGLPFQAAGVGAAVGAILLLVLLRNRAGGAVAELGATAEEPGD